MSDPVHDAGRRQPAHRRSTSDTRSILRPRCPASAKVRRRRLVAAVAAADASWCAQHVLPLLRALTRGREHR